jgi:hypothetical protein
MAGLSVSRGHATRRGPFFQDEGSTGFPIRACAAAVGSPLAGADRARASALTCRIGISKHPQATARIIQWFPPPPGPESLRHQAFRSPDEPQLFGHPRRLIQLSTPLLLMKNHRSDTSHGVLPSEAGPGSRSAGRTGREVQTHVKSPVRRPGATQGKSSYFGAIP